MADPESNRKLAAILAADVAGYSRLMQDDDEATVATLEAYRAVFRERIEAHHGRVVDMAGDSVLAVFEAVTEAVSATVEIQSELTQRNEALPEARRMRFRIGVQPGRRHRKPDGTVYGDGVNIAARLQSIGEPGGICISGDSIRSSEESAESRLRVPRRATGQEHRRAGACVPDSARGLWARSQVRRPPPVRCPRSPCRTSRPSRCCRSTTCRAIRSRNSSPTAWSRRSPRPCPGFAPSS